MQKDQNRIKKENKKTSDKLVMVAWIGSMWRDIAKIARSKLLCGSVRRWRGGSLSSKSLVAAIARHDNVVVCGGDVSADLWSTVDLQDIRITSHGVVTSR
ncbi:hypothetical protein RYX36_012927 [Vicia faba]